MQGSSSPYNENNNYPPYPDPYPYADPYPSPYPYPYPSPSPSPQPQPPLFFSNYPPYPPPQTPDPPTVNNPDCITYPSPTDSYHINVYPPLQSDRFDDAPAIYPTPTSYTDNRTPSHIIPSSSAPFSHDDDDASDNANPIVYPSIISPDHHHHHKNPIYNLFHHTHRTDSEEGRLSNSFDPYPDSENTISSSSTGINFFSGPLPQPRPISDTIYSSNNGQIISGKNKHSWKYHQLYGTFHLHIHSAKNLPNMDMFSESLRQVVSVGLPKVVGLPIIGKAIKSDPYVCFILGGACLARTDVISNSENPVWEQSFTVSVAHKVAEIEFLVKDNDIIGAQYIGEVKIPSERVLSSYPITKEYFPLLNRDDKPCKQGAELQISLTYWPVDRDPMYRYGVGMDHRGVPNTYFPLRRGCRLTLYQDAHVPHGLQPQIQLAGGKKFEPRSCWDDICQAILDAQHLIYIAGWSIYTKITLVRDKERPRPSEAYLNLGELLKWKAKTCGVRVLLLVWDDKTSHPFFQTSGLMGTHDEETRDFFRHSHVHCLLAPRHIDNKLSLFKQHVDASFFTHHQKLVIVDTESYSSSSKRNLAAFIGGLDLCNGRYDTPEHSLFCKLDTVFKDDYYNPIFPVKINSKGPRQPWHDLHCKIEGPAVYDVIKNFEERWRRQTKWRSSFHRDALIDLKKASWVMRNVHVTDEFDFERWYIQVFRSIDSGSVADFEKDREKDLIVRKNIKVDMGIQTAYIKAIRSAQHFIYIENQYFLGSSFAWPRYKNAGSNHLVPMELALKIVSKIKAHEEFAVYVIIPMWPEGDPPTQTVQEILFFQSQTMEMMYTLIAEALKEERLDGIHHPTDYLNFFCLGNREPSQGNEPPPMATPNDSQSKAYKSRRFMIYVHSKGMIVDDEYVIIGSANINERSMDGSRDTEIAMGAYQPYHTWAHNKQAPRGQVHGYRMSLWAEHLGAYASSFLQPWKLECVNMVQHLAAVNWKQYTAEEVTAMDGHLLPYPLKVESTGKVVSLENFECFPDVGGRILGTSTPLPDRLTT